MKRRILAAVALSLVGSAGWAAAAELKVYSTIGVQAALEELTPKFEQASGHKLVITWNTAAVLTRRLQAGETADVVVLTRASLDTLAKEGKAAAEPTFASSGMGLVVKKGAARPDISSADAFKRTLLHAATIAYSDPAHGGASGVYLSKLLERMGIAEQVKAKTKHPPQGGNAAILVANGEAALAIQQVPEVISVAGVDFVGELPADLNNVTTYAASAVPGTKQRTARRRWSSSCTRPRRPRCSRRAA